MTPALQEVFEVCRSNPLFEEDLNACVDSKVCSLIADRGIVYIYPNWAQRVYAVEVVGIH